MKGLKKVSDQVREIKPLSFFLGFVGLFYIIFIIVGFKVMLESSTNLIFSVLVDVLYIIVYLVIIYLAYILYTTKSLKKTKIALLIIGPITGINAFLAFIEASWFGFFILLLITIEIFDIYQKVSKLEK